MVGIADKHGISVKEVETVLIRKGLVDLGFECLHPSEHVKRAKKDKTKVYCGVCWTRLKQVSPGVYSGKECVQSPRYRPLPTFLEESAVYHGNKIATSTTEGRRELI